MSVYEIAMGAICDECGNCMNEPFRVYNVINTDYKSHIKDKLISDNINKVTCPKCHSTFTYEHQFLAFSHKKGYAVFGICQPEIRTLTCGRNRIFEMMNIRNTRFRLVDFLCEVAEKIVIFESGLDDISIETVKHRNFSESYFADNSDKNLLFKGIDNDDMIFEYINCLDKVLETHRIPLSEYPKTASDYEPETLKDGYILWTKIDNKYIKELYNE